MGAPQEAEPGFHRRQLLTLPQCAAGWMSLGIHQASCQDEATFAFRSLVHLAFIYPVDRDRRCVRRPLCRRCSSFLGLPCRNRFCLMVSSVAENDSWRNRCACLATKSSTARRASGSQTKSLPKSSLASLPMAPPGSTLPEESKQAIVTQSRSGRDLRLAATNNEPGRS